MREVTHCHLSLDVYVGQKWSLVIDSKREDAVLIWQAKRGAEHGAVGCLRDGLEIESVEGRKHGEFHLEGICLGHGERGEMVVGVFRHFYVEGLQVLNQFPTHAFEAKLQDSPRRS